jgi:hypothetical protein
MKFGTSFKSAVIAAPQLFNPRFSLERRLEGPRSSYESSAEEKNYCTCQESEPNYADVYVLV